jgi:hypothetical protein
MCGTLCSFQCQQAQNRRLLLNKVSEFEISFCRSQPKLNIQFFLTKAANKKSLKTISNIYKVLI